MFFCKKSYQRITNNKKQQVENEINKCVTNGMRMFIYIHEEINNKNKCDSQNCKTRYADRNKEYTFSDKPVKSFLHLITIIF